MLNRALRRGHCSQAQEKFQYYSAQEKVPPKESQVLNTRFLAIAILLTTLFTLGCVERHPLAGNWLGKDAEGHESALFFRETGEFEAISQAEKLKGKWTLDETTDPVQLKLDFEDDETVTTIIKLQGDALLVEGPDPEAGSKLPEKFSERALQYRRRK